MLLMTVGKAAMEANVSAKAIRYWESRGLIPNAERTAAGYRVFTDADIARLRFIRQAKMLGLTLSEIEDIIQLQNAGACPCGQVAQAIDVHLSAIDRSISESTQLRDALAKARNAARGTCRSGVDTLVCHIIEGTRG